MIDRADRMLDWDYMIHAIERAEPVHPPGARTGYHGLTFGYLVGEILERVTGVPFPDLVRKARRLYHVLGRDAAVDAKIVETLEALRLRPDHARTVLHLAELLEAEGRLAEAANGYTRALALDPDLETARSRLEALSVSPLSPESSTE